MWRRHFKGADLALGDLEEHDDGEGEFIEKVAYTSAAEAEQWAAGGGQQPDDKGGQGNGGKGKGDEGKGDEGKGK